MNDDYRRRDYAGFEIWTSTKKCALYRHLFPPPNHGQAKTFHAVKGKKIWICTDPQTALVYSKSSLQVHLSQEISIAYLANRQDPLWCHLVV